jgi:RsiW-degrading membrane proteinase PrsW (M82 family)
MLSLFSLAYFINANPRCFFLLSMFVITTVMLLSPSAVEQVAVFTEQIGLLPTIEAPLHVVLCRPPLSLWLLLLCS